LYGVLFDSIHSPIIDKSKVAHHDPGVDGFLLQFAVYRLTMVVVALIALFSKIKEYIFIVSVGVATLNVFFVLACILLSFYDLQLAIAVLLVLVGTYCAWHTKSTTNKYA
jgi:predicted neutral ceramidase superfamily lipid hydrolase